jgi:hypothetical protein
MKIDLHPHSRYSNDNLLDPQTVIGQAIHRKLDGVCFTEHHSYEASRAIEELVLPAGFCVLEGFDAAERHKGINTPEAYSRAVGAAMCRMLPSIGEWLPQARTGWEGLHCFLQTVKQLRGTNR